MGGLVSGPATIFGSILSAEGLRREGQFRAAIQGFQAQEIERASIDEIVDLERKQNAFLGAQRAAFASRGVKIDVGTPLAVFAETNRLGAEAVRRIQSRTRAEATQLRMGAKAALQTSRLQAKAALIQGMGSGFGQIAGGATQVAGARG